MRKYNYKKIAALLTVAATVITAQTVLTGCKLAVSETKTIEKDNGTCNEEKDVSTLDNSEDSNKDELVGVAIFAYDLYEAIFDEYLTKEEMMSIYSYDSDTAETEMNRIYAKKDGKDNNKYSFNLSNCVGLYTYYNKELHYTDYYFDGDGTYFSKTNFTANMSEENTVENVINSQIYLNEDYIDRNEEVQIYYYAVYANEKGDLYIDVLDGNASSFITNKDAKCSSSHSVSEESKTETGGKKVAEKNTFTIASDVKKPADKVKIVCMDKEGKVIESSSYNSKKLPEEIRVAKGTEKVTVKAYQGEKTVSRELVTKEDIDEGYEVLVCIEGSIPEVLECTEVSLVK